MRQPPIQLPAHVEAGTQADYSALVEQADCFPADGPHSGVQTWQSTYHEEDGTAGTFSTAFLCSQAFVRFVLLGPLSEANIKALDELFPTTMAMAGGAVWSGTSARS